MTILTAEIRDEDYYYVFSVKTGERILYGPARSYGTEEDLRKKLDTYEEKHPSYYKKTGIGENGVIIIILARNNMIKASHIATIRRKELGFPKPVEQKRK